jgi:hypothetical protein
MTNAEKTAYALAQRQACKPVECTAAPACWVALGTADSLSNKIQGTPRCAACGGKVRIDAWRSPKGQEASRPARPQGPRGRETQPGDVAEAEGVSGSVPRERASFLA